MQHGIAQRDYFMTSERMIEMNVMWFFTTDKASVVTNFIHLDLICFFQGALLCSNHLTRPS